MPDIDLANNWLSFTISFFTAGAAVILVVWKLSKHTHTIDTQAERTDERFVNQGTRIGIVEKRQESLEATVASAKEVNQRQEFKIHELEKTQSEVDSKLDRIMDALDNRTAQKYREDLGLTERLTRIETQLEISNQLREIANQLNARNGASHG